MNDKLMLGDFIAELRREKNLSQAELGELVGVSNKAVSKWETFEANPDLNIIKKLAAVLGVTTDELLSCQRSVDTDNGGSDINNNNINNTANSDVNNTANSNANIDDDDNFFAIRGKVNKTSHSFEFISAKKTKKGTPYLHINFGKDKDGKILRAKGIIALGLISKGIVSIGLLSFGILSIGLLAFGLVALGTLAFGLVLALGGVAAGIGISVGGVAIGTLAVGGVAIGVMSVGGLSIGVWAHTGELGKAIGMFCYYH